jgi:hypothetical protein
MSTTYTSLGNICLYYMSPEAHVNITQRNTTRPRAGGSPRGLSARVAGARPGLRPDVQALRAVAVTLVVAEHLTGRPVGP